MAYAQQNRPDRRAAARAPAAARAALPDAHGWPGEGAMLAAEERLQSLGASRPEARRIHDFLSKLVGLAGIAPVAISDLKAHASAIIAKSAKSGPIAIANAKQKDAERMVMSGKATCNRWSICCCAAGRGAMGPLMTCRRCSPITG